jgi:hypothetical protein
VAFVKIAQIHANTFKMKIHRYAKWYPIAITSLKVSISIRIEQDANIFIHAATAEYSIIRDAQAT